MDDKDEVEGLLVGHAVEDEHRLHGEVPGTGTVGRGHDDGDGAHDEGDQGTRETQVGGEVEAEESEVVMEEVAEPDAHGHEHEQRQAAHALQRDDALPDATQRSLYLIIYRKVAQKQMEQHAHGQQTDGGDDPSGPGEAAQDAADVRARLAEESAEGAHLQQQRGADDSEHEQHVDHALGDHRAQGAREGDALPALHHAASREFADAGHHQRGGIAQEDAVHADGAPGLAHHGLQRLPPAPATQCLGQDAEGEAEQHPRPVHLVQYHLPDAVEVEATVHPVQDGSAQQQGQQYLCYLPKAIHTLCKDTNHKRQVVQEHYTL